MGGVGWGSGGGGQGGEGLGGLGGGGGVLMITLIRGGYRASLAVPIGPPPTLRPGESADWAEARRWLPLRKRAGEGVGDVGRDKVGHIAAVARDLLDQR